MRHCVIPSADRCATFGYGTVTIARSAMQRRACYVARAPENQQEHPMKRNHFLCGGFAALLSSLPAYAALPTYTGIELQARSNLLVNDAGWNLPPGTSFNSISANINDEGQVAFTAGVVPIDGDLSRNGAGVWLGSHASGQIVAIHEAPPSGDPNEPATMLISDRPGLNNLGQIVYYTSVDGGPYTLRKYDPGSGQSTPVSLLPLTPSSISNPDISDSGAIGFKGRMGLGYGIAMGGNGAASLFAVDSNVDESSGYAYIYSPATSESGKIAVKVSTSDYSHNEIRLFAGLGDSRLIVADKATDATSTFAAFDNGLGVNKNGAVAVAVKLADGNQRALYRFTPSDSGVEATEIARVDAAGTIRDIELFAPAINDDGVVVFRAKDEHGQAIYAGDGASLVRIAGQSDAIDTDLGKGQIGQHDDSPIFSGAPAVNKHGDVVFVAGLHPQGDNQVEWGNGVFVAYAQRAPDDVIFKNGFDG
jgi:hypothetical protein